MRKHLLLFTVLLTSVYTPRLVAQESLPANTASEAKTSPADSNSHSLQISAGDLLDVTVFDTPELSGKLRVDGQGTVTLPLAGNVSVSRLTAEQAGHAIQEKLLQMNILKDPHVLITVLEYSTQGVTVLGEVKLPGVYPLQGPHVVLDLISAAGGFTPDAGELVTITHRGDPDHPIDVRIGSRVGGSAPGSNIDIRPGDTIMVSHAGIVYVLGDVGKPGGFLIQRENNLTVLRAVALAQGTNKTAALNSAKLIHQTARGKEEISLPLKKILSNKESDRTLADGDILFIPSSGVKNALVTAEAILPATAGAAVYRVP